MQLDCLAARLSLYLVFLCELTAVTAIQLNVQDTTSLKNAAGTAANGMMSYYHGNESGQIPGTLDNTWWEAGVMFMTMIEYWNYTGDASNNAAVTQGMIHQSGTDNNYLPANSTDSLGNDDQMFWGLAAITAAELKNPDVENGPSWLALAQGVFNTQIGKWDTKTCGGGMRWQMWTWNPGYDLKNSVSNGGLFALAARLARYTRNKEYTDWATKIWDWAENTPLINNHTWFIADSTEATNGCKSPGTIQYSYNYGLWMLGSAYMYGMEDENQPEWLTRTEGLVNASLREFFPQKYDGTTPHGTIMSEIACEASGKCDRNMMCYKSFLATWLAFVGQVVPSTAERIKPKLQTTAEAVAKSCTGPDNACGVKWYEEKFDGNKGLEPQMSAVGAFLSNLILGSDNKPVTSDTGGTSKGDPNAGKGSRGQEKGTQLKPITVGDKAGAAILTVLVSGSWVALAAWLFIE